MELIQLAVSGAITGSSYALLAVGFGLILQVTGRFHLAFSVSYALAGFLAAQVTASSGAPWFVALIVGALAAALVGVLIENFIYWPLAPRAGNFALRDNEMVRVSVRAPVNAAAWVAYNGSTQPLVNTGGNTFSTDVAARNMRTPPRLIIARGPDTVRLNLARIGAVDSLAGRWVQLGDPAGAFDQQRLVRHGLTILVAVGYNPYRRFRAGRADYILVAAAAVLALALVGWALLG